MHIEHNVKEIQTEDLISQSLRDDSVITPIGNWCCDIF